MNPGRPASAPGDCLHNCSRWAMGVVLGEEGRGRRERKSWACHLSPPASLPGLRKTIRKRKGKGGRPGSPSPSPSSSLLSPSSAFLCKTPPNDYKQSSGAGH
ncbi:hypothetical protein PPACK8108_LOCUS14239 [Phakopsora pachyrhizi]|uniref:Uncharacterized protein n=1 Tax=Phakopsora pachyrhizi TaxID=170000 RepID=A0AAV0B7W9_PHAPC|nr:hypothetical protein PPACK8108_LOCUS14239 [Phakopsora pachyrhizi]